MAEKIISSLGGRAASTTPARDFGMLKVRSLKVKQAQADIIQNSKDLMTFERMSNDRLFEIIGRDDINQKRNLSRWYFKKSGMYSRAVRYIADLYKFDFIVHPNFALDEEIKEERQKKILKKYDEILDHFDISTIQLLCRRWAIHICLEGCYYGYVCDDVNDKIVIQDLPVEYCRSRFMHRGLPLVEFNVQYFDKATSDEETREKLLSLFPQEIQKGYRKFKNDQLQAETRGDKPGWILLDINRAFKFYFSEDDIPPFLTAIPSLLELQEVRDLEKEKLLQEIQKILVQTFELDKNGQLPFTMPELQRLNQNAIDMVGDAVGVSVLSTIANVHLEDVASSKASDSQNTIDAAEDDAYNQFGISTNLFNTDGNLALDKSITIDEAFAKPMMLQFEAFFNRYLDWKFNKKDLKFKFKMFPTTIFNFKDYNKEYESLTKLGYSRFYPAVAMGHGLKEVISLAKLEQQILQLDLYMLPPFSSNTMSSDTWNDIKNTQRAIIDGKSVTIAAPKDQGTNGTASNDTEKSAGEIGSSNDGGRPALPDDKKSDKTIANNASK